MDVGWRKPNVAPMLRALDLLRATAAGAFVGDDPQWDIEGAKRAGVGAVLLDASLNVVALDCSVIPNLAALVDLLDSASFN